VLSDFFALSVQLLSTEAYSSLTYDKTERFHYHKHRSDHNRGLSAVRIHEIFAEVLVETLPTTE
jgi:hypothetical protein